MMQNRKALALFICLLMALALTACHVNDDPWPVSDGLPAATATPLSTEEPTQQPIATEASQEAPVVMETQAPAEPEPTQTPGGSEEPGFNG